jgi:S1-C subfamily serine protease
VAVGNALGLGGTPSVAQGTVSAVDQSIVAGDSSAGRSEQLTGLIETNAQLQPGDSGGPLLNSSGQVIGMDTAASSGSQFDTATASFAIPINTAMSIVHQIQQKQAGSTVLLGQTGFLGVGVQDGAAGAVITGVASNSTAEGAGLSSGDVITTFDGQPVTSASGLTALVNKTHPGNQVNVGWVDQSGRSHTATVQLTTGPVK